MMIGDYKVYVISYALSTSHDWEKLIRCQDLMILKRCDITTVILCPVSMEENNVKPAQSINLSYFNFKKNVFHCQK